MCERGILPVSPSSNSTVIRSPSSSRPSKPVGGGAESGGRRGAETSREAVPGAGCRRAGAQRAGRGLQSQAVPGAPAPSPAERAAVSTRPETLPRSTKNSKDGAVKDTERAKGQQRCECRTFRRQHPCGQEELPSLWALCSVRGLEGGGTKEKEPGFHRGAPGSPLLSTKHLCRQGCRDPTPGQTRGCHGSRGCRLYAWTLGTAEEGGRCHTNQGDREVRTEWTQAVPGAPAPSLAKRAAVSTRPKTLPRSTKDGAGVIPAPFPSAGH